MKALLYWRAISLFLFVAIVSETFAEANVRLTIQRLTQKADLVLQGIVTRKSVQRDDVGRIYTKVKLEIAEVWKGKAPPADFVIVQAGGVLGDEATSVSGQEEFEVGEEVAVFLVLNQRGEGVVIGISQGKFRISREAGSNETIASNGFPGARARESGAGGRRVSTGPLTVAELKQRVRVEVK